MGPSERTSFLPTHAFGSVRAHIFSPNACIWVLPPSSRPFPLSKSVHFIPSLKHSHSPPLPQTYLTRLRSPDEGIWRKNEQNTGFLFQKHPIVTINELQDAKRAENQPLKNPQIPLLGGHFVFWSSCSRNLKNMFNVVMRNFYEEGEGRRYSRGIK
ncbi:hypothetical protein NPIL_304341 [Nephila pilipes]|uniref:Uncharacterized protein n=1 Tax=Nephila pilipes TaxID=299642 RepID=A0A8X6Q7U6_NEPPI|nr:hypothetical protein NPIL_304341 [Nephila pilipes]